MTAEQMQAIQSAKASAHQLLADVTQLVANELNKVLQAADPQAEYQAAFGDGTFLKFLIEVLLPLIMEILKNLPT